MAQGVPSHRKALHLRVEPLIPTFDLSCIWGGGTRSADGFKSEKVAPRGASSRHYRGTGVRAVPASAGEGAVPSDSGQ